MTVNTRSSANYGHVLVPTTTTLPATINRTAAVTQSSSSHDPTDNVLPTTSTTLVNVDIIMASKNEAIQKFLRSYEAHLQKQFKVRQMRWNLSIFEL